MIALHTPRLLKQRYQLIGNSGVCHVTKFLAATRRISEAATAQWQRLLQGEWPGFEGATMPKDQAPATIPADSPIRHLYLLALIEATKHPQILGHRTICLTVAKIVLVLTKEMMATGAKGHESPSVGTPLAAHSAPRAHQ